MGWRGRSSPSDCCFSDAYFVAENCEDLPPSLQRHAEERTAESAPWTSQASAASYSTEIKIHEKCNMAGISGSITLSVFGREMEIDFKHASEKGSSWAALHSLHLPPGFGELYPPTCPYISAGVLQHLQPTAGPKLQFCPESNGLLHPREDREHNVLVNFCKSCPYHEDAHCRRWLDFDGSSALLMRL